MSTSELAPLREDLPPFLAPYLPPQGFDPTVTRPFTTLTYAQSLDSRISKGHGVQTVISHPETKTMTHYLRYHHDGILIGTGTVLADNPGLCCLWMPSDNNAEWRTPRPIVIDLLQKWKFTGSMMWELYKNGKGKPPIVIVMGEPHNREDGVSYLSVPGFRFEWDYLVKRLYEEYEIKSLMVEGGASVINNLLIQPELVDSLVITLGPTFLGKQGIEVSPQKCAELENISWWHGTRDAIMCANLATKKK